ncbi:MAG: hypothetical protein K2O76_00970, partial [Mailhella sp.]|nr:hypothetical protein [Mailhella sp.]
FPFSEKNDHSAQKNREKQGNELYDFFIYTHGLPQNFPHLTAIFQNKQVAIPKYLLYNNSDLKLLTISKEY